MSDFGSAFSALYFLKVLLSFILEMFETTLPKEMFFKIFGFEIYVNGGKIMEIHPLCALIVCHV